MSGGKLSATVQFEWYVCKIIDLNEVWTTETKIGVWSNIEQLFVSYSNM